MHLQLCDAAKERKPESAICVHCKKHNQDGMSKAKLELILKSKGIQYVTEHRFHPTRKWRFDYAIPERKIAIEYNGIMSSKSRHTTVIGYSNDLEKINQAQLLGWKVLQYTPLNVGQLVDDLG